MGKKETNKSKKQVERQKKKEQAIFGTESEVAEKDTWKRKDEVGIEVEEKERWGLQDNERELILNLSFLFPTLVRLRSSIVCLPPTPPTCPFLLYFPVVPTHIFPGRSVSQNSAGIPSLPLSPAKKSCPSGILEHLAYAFAWLGGTFEIVLGANLLGYSHSL